MWLKATDWKYKLEDLILHHDVASLPAFRQGRPNQMEVTQTSLHSLRGPEGSHPRAEDCEEKEREGREAPRESLKRGVGEPGRKERGKTGGRRRERARASGGEGKVTAGISEGPIVKVLSAR